MATAPTKASDRPDLVKPSRGKTTKPGDEIGYLPAQEDGKYLCYRNINTHQIFQSARGLMSDPNYEPLYMTKEEIVAQAAG